MTVAELIELLKAVPQNLEVIAEGCDCYGTISGCAIQERIWDEPKRTVVAIERGYDL